MRINVEERFWSKVVKGELDECWNWTACVDKDSYGLIKIKRKTIRAHRFSYELHKGPIPFGLLCCHTCDTSACVNPNHLFLGTYKTNMQDAAKKGRMATGNRNGSHTHPERRARGDRNGSRLHPELLNPPRGEKHCNAKLKTSDIQIIRRLLKEGTMQKDIAQRFNVSQNAIWKVLSGKTWKHVQKRIGGI